MQRTIIIFLSICTLTLASIAQDNAKKAYEIGLQAIEIMDQGKYDESIELLKKSKKLDPDNYLYPYEIGYAYFLKKDPKNAIKTLHKVIKMEGCNDQSFTLLGNIYDIEGDPDKAMEIYNLGLGRFPNSGRLHFESGNVLEVLKEYEKALAMWETGIEKEPIYPSNYYTTTIYYSKYTKERIWGVLYGEAFMNIERGSKRTEKISKTLYDTYLKSINIESDSSVNISFSKNMTMTFPTEGEKLKLPFSMSYELTMSVAAVSAMGDGKVEIGSLHKIRKSFIEMWFDKEHNGVYPNLIFDWHKKLIYIGHFEAYNYWLFSKGNEAEFNSWLEGNQSKFDDFISWYTKNPLQISAESYFHRNKM